jgi:hypothetical protein
MGCKNGEPLQARSALERLLKENPSDQVIQMYLERLQSLSGTLGRALIFEFDVK